MTFEVCRVARRQRPTKLGQGASQRPLNDFLFACDPPAHLNSVVYRLKY